MRDRHLAAFRRATGGLRGAAPAPLEPDQWWALGRHYGLITPLLDWTESPYIAAFFPLSELWVEMQTPGGMSFTGRAVAVYRLFHNEKLEGDGLRVVRPLVDELGRMHSQRGLFTWLDSERFFELQGFVDNTDCGDLLTQVIISDQAVMDGLRDLKAHGIDYRLLFPDLFGAAKHAIPREPGSSTCRPLEAPAPQHRDERGDDRGDVGVLPAARTQARGPASGSPPAPSSTARSFRLSAAGAKGLSRSWSPPASGGGTVSV